MDIEELIILEKQITEEINAEFKKAKLKELELARGYAELYRKANSPIKCNYCEKEATLKGRLPDGTIVYRCADSIADTKHHVHIAHWELIEKDGN